MKFISWVNLRLWRREERYRAINERLAEIERRLDKLAQGNASVPPVVIEKAEKVIIERVTYSNHFGTLDIDSLEGQLNIGLNCRGPADLPEGLVPITSPSNQGGPSAGRPSPGVPESPRYNIRSRQK